MIKLLSRDIARQRNIEKNKLIEIIKNSIYRNFGGKYDAAKFIGEQFASKERIRDLYLSIEQKETRDLVRMNL